MEFLNTRASFRDSTESKGSLAIQKKTVKRGWSIVKPDRSRKRRTNPIQIDRHSTKRTQFGLDRHSVPNEPNSNTRDAASERTQFETESPASVEGQDTPLPLFKPSSFPTHRPLEYHPFLPSPNPSLTSSNTHFTRYHPLSPTPYHPPPVYSHQLPLNLLHPSPLTLLFIPFQSFLKPPPHPFLLFPSPLHPTPLLPFSLHSPLIPLSFYSPISLSILPSPPLTTPTPQHNPLHPHSI